MSRGILLLAGALVASAGCLGSNEKPATPPPAVTVSYPIQREVTDYAVYTGRTAAVKSVAIIPRATGYIMEIPFKEGDEVKAGDLLFQIDPRPYQALVDQAKAQLALNQAQLKYSESVVRRDIATNGAAGIQAVSQEQLDQDRSTAAQNAASIDVAKANIALQELNLSFTKVTSPIDGRVSNYFFTLGNLAVQDQSRLTTVVSQDPIYAYFDVDEATVIRVHELIREGKLSSIRVSGTRVSVWLALGTEQGYPHEGYIDFANNEFTASTATLRVRGVFANPKPSVGERLLTPAMFVRVRVPVSHAHPALLIAQGAVTTDQDVRFVYVLNDQNEVVRRNVKLGGLHEGLQEIIEGIGPGDRIIVNGLQRAHPGGVVNPKLEPMPVPAKDALESSAPPVMKAASNSNQKR